jgi:hypothetical protein
MAKKINRGGPQRVVNFLCVPLRTRRLSGSSGKFSASLGVLGGYPDRLENNKKSQIGRING